VCVCAFVVVGVGEVLAKGVESIFAGKVLVLRKAPPTYFKSKNGFVKFLRGNRVSTVYENKDHTWTFPTMSFFKRPLGDYEVQVVFYDVTAGKTDAKRKFVDSYGQNTMDRNTRSLFHRVQITRPAFDAKRNYMIVMQGGGGRELAKGFFSTKGVTQAALDEQKRIEYEMKKMEESMKDLQKKVKEQEEREKKENDKAADDLF
jgi:hypothetical protein